MTTMLSTTRIPTVATSGTSKPQEISSADAIAGSDDLLIKILLRLPIRSLLKFKSVSKHWFSLISSPNFSLLRHPKSNPISGLFLHISSSIFDLQYEFVRLNGRPSTSPFFRPLSFIDDPTGIRILQSCNGFLLCCFSNSGEDSKEQKYFIYNPTTQQFTLLPELLDQVFNPVVGVGIAFDPSKSLHYKVVCVRSIDSERPYRFWIEIYSSESGSWRQSGDLFTAPGDKFDHGVFWNGAIHWINNLRSMRIGNLGIIVSFDVNKEKLREIPMPETPDDLNQRMIKYFGESRNHLHLILLQSTGTTRLSVYEMERDYSKWFVKHQVDVDALLMTEFPAMRRNIQRCSHILYYAFSILCLVREENDEESFLVLSIPCKAIMCYSFKEETFKKLCDLAQNYISSGWQCAYQYVESLAYVQ